MTQSKTSKSATSPSLPVAKGKFESIPPVVNAAGTLTALGGCRTRPEAIRAMSEAAANFTPFETLQKKTGEYLAALLDVPAALVTAGAAPGLTLAAAACMVGDDHAAAARLPLPPPKHKFIIQCSHRGPFERAILFSGAQLCQVGDAIRTRPADLESAVDEVTAGVVFFLQGDMLDSSLSLSATIKIAHAHSLPVIVDAAAELPPRSNLWELVHLGADLVLFSGGKDLRGPQASGLMVGRKDLVASALMQSAPHEHVLGRLLKPDKGAVMGLVAAVEAYLQEDEAARFALWEQNVRTLMDGFNILPGLKAESFKPTQPYIQPACVPRVALTLDLDASLSVSDLKDALWKASPPVAAEIIGGKLIFNLHTLKIAEIEYILQQVEACLRSCRKTNAVI
jgi:L-seryl-tRNA(Ser) seleniumtransferase